MGRRRPSRASDREEGRRANIGHGPVYRPVFQKGRRLQGGGGHRPLSQGPGGGGGSTRDGVGAFGPGWLATTMGGKSSPCFATREEEAKNSALFAVGRFKSDIFDHRAMQAKIKKLALRQAFKLADRLAIGAVTATAFVQVAKECRDAVKNAMIGRADNIRIHCVAS